MKQKMVLITGGAGFIGAQVNKKLINQGYATLIFDNLSRGNRQAVKNGIFIKGDLANPAEIMHIFEKYSIDAVIHFAAFTDVGESISNPQKYYSNNLINTLNLLSAMLSYKVNTFIFSSSAAIFGIPKTEKVSENHPCNPISPYGRSKYFIEQILKDYHHAYNMKFSCLRYFNAAGGDPDQEICQLPNRKENNLIPLVLQSLKNGNPLTIFGTDYPTPDGTCIRDYIHIDDLAEAHLLAMEQLLCEDKTTSYYNLGNGNGFSVREILTAAEIVTGKKPLIFEGERRAGDPPILVADSTHAHKQLSWKPKYTKIETIIEHAWNCSLLS